MPLAKMVILQVADIIWEPVLHSLRRNSGTSVKSDNWRIGILKDSIKPNRGQSLYDNFSQPFNSLTNERGTILKKIYSSVLVSIVMLIASMTIHAAPIAGSSTGIFENPIGPEGMVTTGNGTPNFTWGTGLNSPPSSMSFSGNSFNTETGLIFSFGTLSYYNGITALGTEATSVDLNVTASFTTPSGIVGSFLYNLGLITTPNTSDPNASADIVQFQTIFPSSSFTSNGIDYTLEFLGFGNVSGGGFTSVNQFHVLEGARASAGLYGRITENVIPAVPEPETYAMLLIGIGLIGFQLHRQKGTKDSTSMFGRMA